MFGIDALQYLVFLIIAIPPFFIGYFKGWRSALFTLILIILTGAILTGVSFAIYDSFLWPLFRKTILYTHNYGSLDVNSLKEISKLSVISLSIGIGLIPGSLLFVGMYFSFRKLLNKYMQPIIKKISNNESIISRKNLKFARIGGVLINGTVGVIVASTVIGAVSTLTTTPNSSFFTKITNTLGDAMTFGQGQYDNDFQEIFELVNDGKYYSKEITKFRNLFTLSQDGNGNINNVDSTCFSDFTTSSPEHLDFLKDMNSIAYNSPRVSKALMIMFLRSSTANKNLNIIGFNLDKQNSSEGNVMKKIDERDLNIENSFNLLSDKLKSVSKTIGIKWNEKGVLEGITDFFNKRIFKFTDSPYFVNWNNQTNLLSKEDKTLENRIKDSNRLFLEIKKNREALDNQIKLINTNSNKIRSSWNKIAALWNKIGKNTAIKTPEKIDFQSDFWKDKIYIKNGLNSFELLKNTITNLSPLPELSWKNENGDFKSWENSEAIKKEKYNILENKMNEWNDSKEREKLFESQLINDKTMLESSKEKETEFKVSLNEINNFIENEYDIKKNKLESSELSNKENDLKVLEQELLRNKNQLKTIKDNIEIENSFQIKTNIKIKGDIKNISDSKEEVIERYKEYLIIKNEYENSVDNYKDEHAKLENDIVGISNETSIINNLKNEISNEFLQKKTLEETLNKNIDLKYQLDDLSKNSKNEYVNKNSIVWQKDHIQKMVNELKALEIKKDRMNNVYLDRKKMLLKMFTNAITM